MEIVEPSESDGSAEAPPLAEFYSFSQLEQLARALAEKHQLAPASRWKGDRLLPRLKANEIALRGAHALLTAAVKRGRRVTPAAEWLIDNYHLIEEQIRTARKHLPAGYNRELPRLARAEGTSVPRVYDLALDLVSHSHGHLDIEGLRAFVVSYQTVQTLRLGELWAIPIMLRLSLIENLRRVVASVTAGRNEREEAGRWVDRMIQTAASAPARVVLVLAEMVRANPPLTNAFAAELASRLQGHAQLLFAMSWVEQRLAERGETLEHVFQLVSQSQAADQVSIGNCIGSLRLLGATDWRVFVEAMSAVEKRLAADPAGSYLKMDFATRDRYRHVVEEIARGSALSEEKVAQAALALAREGVERASHVGYFLIGEGRTELEQAAKMRLPFSLRVRRATSRARYAVYAGSILALTATGALALLQSAEKCGLPRAWRPLAALLFAFVASQLAIAIVHLCATLIAHPRLLPRLDFSHGIPPEHQTAVAVPALLIDAAEIDGLLESLEVRYLANRDANLSFVLLTDFRDAHAEQMDGDEVLLLRAREGVAALNERHAGPGAATPFHLLHRRRRWNASQDAWMGWERKRGKLEQLNEALRGKADSFDTTVGDLQALQGVQFVIVLDSDTQLPRDAARALAGTLAHPLNRPRFDERLNRFTEGYAILQPRVAITMESANRSRFAQLFSGEPGIDPYTRAVSNVYQDVFDEGSFVGKGIYDVDAFQRAIGGRLPENRILSHDLLEGAYARAGLVSDVLLFEDHPAGYAAEVSRRHRWMRGDWQILAWLRSRVPGASRGSSVANPISRLSQWKILDNLRRSLVPISLFALLLFGWSRERCAALATLIVVTTLALPGLLAAAASLWRRPDDLSIVRHLRDIAEGLATQLLREAFALACMPYDVAISASAILRTAVRVLFTRKKLLEWRTAREAQRSAANSLATSYLAMIAAPISALLAGCALWIEQRSSLVFAAPILTAWLIAPALAAWLSQPAREEEQALSLGQVLFLRRVARRTWRFFDEFVTAEDNFLPPDNQQEDPPQGLAHRTSPTNIGLALTANLAAYDFGYLSVGEVLARCGQTITTLERMQRHRGHFYNWYDTKTLEPLRPLYVSTVDSGNMCGHLMILAAGLRALAHEPVFRARTFAGLSDALALVTEQAELGKGSSETLAELAGLRTILENPPGTLALCQALLERLLPVAAGLLKTAEARGERELIAWSQAFATQLQCAWDELSQVTNQSDAQGQGPVRAAALQSLAARAVKLSECEREFLYDRERKLLSIGYTVAEHRLDHSFYDLLASESRLGSFVAIAQGKLPQEHWFILGRQLTTLGGKAALLSWSGSMFEYLMPLLVMPTWRGTLLDETYRAVVERQIEYGHEHSVPWGISESGYNKTDAHLNYQYRAFGVPGLGFKRGLADDLVIAPYASAMALMVAPESSCENLERLAREGRLGPYGFYEAVDYTPSRQPRDRESTTVASYMAHHQGMAFLALDYVLQDKPMQRRFALEPAFRATELLLQERVPRALVIHPHPGEISPASDAEQNLRVFNTAGTPSPQLQLLSNGSYHVMVTNAGAGYSRWRDLAVTRWIEDPTRDPWGSFCYLRDLESGQFWSAGHQPSLAPAAGYEAIFSQGRAELRRRDGEIDTHVEIGVSPEDDVEVRLLSLTNFGTTPRTIELTSYAEVVLASAGSDVAHPAFSNLFVQTELLRDQHALLCTRRPRSESEKPPWMLHLMSVNGAEVGTASYETGRSEFIGRGRTPIDPQAMHQERLGDGAGAVLDPIAAIRAVVLIQPDETVRVTLVTGVAETREAALSLIGKYSDRHAAARVFELAWTHSQVLMRRLDATEADTQLYERLAGHLLYANPSMRAQRSLLVRNQRGQAALWAYAISGDLPIALVRIADRQHLALVRQLVQAHAWLRNHGLSTDLVIWNEDPSGYRQVLHDEILGVIASLGEAELVDKPGGIFVRRADQIAEQDKVLFQTVARVIVVDTEGTLADQLNKPRLLEAKPPPLERARSRVRSLGSSSAPTDHRSDLVGWNGFGGFTPDGREYVITSNRKQRTPAPWVNVLANPYFGTVISESGSAYTWCENARNHRLTPWNNDPVGDAGGEAFYLRDEEDGVFWSPTLLPAPSASPYTTRHGFGYSVFETESFGIASELRTFVATDAPLKFLLFRLKNRTGERRKISLTGFFELVLGENRASNTPYLITELDAASGALLAKNPYSTEFYRRVAFLDCSEPLRTHSGDRLEIIGRNQSAANPACMANARLSGRLGAGLDPCLAMQVQLDLAAGEEREVCFTFGSGMDLSDARTLLQRFRGVAAAKTALEAVWAHWSRTLSAVHVKTPDASFNFLTNGWLLYQVMAARLWARSGFYQSGGAFGFRDQLQDAMSLVHAQPALLREQIVRSAERQFREGDVQHWWHPPMGRGVRTRISDDYLWLPYAVCRYVGAIGDTGVLEERAPFLEGRAVKPGEDSYYDLPIRSEESGTVYEHCVRAIEHGLTFGAHGLPLMGSGDWNDGMNLVGDQGKGESVWLAFFLHDVLVKFAEIARKKLDAAFADKCVAAASALSLSIDAHAWDGAWYLRAWFDSGEPLGSASNVDCQIDSLPQSWSMLTSAAAPARAKQALQALDARLVKRDLGLIQLFDPPFDRSGANPGYVKGYVPGVRENGGQYTHAAVWAVMAFAAAGDVKRAWELFGLINPVRHGDNEVAIARYKVEPYVVSADVYTNPQHAGRGGWTWYTGSAGWMYRLALESLLGIRLEVDRLRLEPLLPAGWGSFEVHYRYRSSRYHLRVSGPQQGGRGVIRILLDGAEQGEPFVHLADDGADHHVEIELGPASA